MNWRLRSRPGGAIAVRDRPLLGGNQRNSRLWSLPKAGNICFGAVNSAPWMPATGPMSLFRKKDRPALCCWTKEDSSQLEPPCLSVDATAVACIRIQDQSVHDASVGSARRHGRGDEFPLLSCLAGLVLIEVDDLNSHRGMYQGACLGLPTFEQRTGSCPRCARHRTGSGMPTASHNAAVKSVPKMASARRGQAKCLDGIDNCQMAPPAGVEPTTYRLGGGRSIH